MTSKLEELEKKYLEMFETKFVDEYSNILQNWVDVDDIAKQEVADLLLKNHTAREMFSNSHPLYLSDVELVKYLSKWIEAREYELSVQDLLLTKQLEVEETCGKHIDDIRKAMTQYEERFLVDFNEQLTKIITDSVEREQQPLEG